MNLKTNQIPESTGRASSQQRHRNKEDTIQEDQIRQETLLWDKPDVVVATPSGLLAHIQNGSIQLKQSVEMFVVDDMAR